jgi:hypothetical protein
MEVDALGNPVVAFSDESQGGQVSVRRWNGSAWVSIGTGGLSPGAVQGLDLALTASGDPVVAYSDATNGGKATVTAWSGSSWAVLGVPSFTTGAANQLVMELDNAGLPVVAFRDGASQNKLSVARWNGTAWVLVGGAGVSPGSASMPSLVLTATGDPLVAYGDGANGGRTTVLQWNGSAWAGVGLAGFTTDASSWQRIGLDPGGVPLIARRDNLNGVGSFHRWNGSAWVHQATMNMNSLVQCVWNSAGNPVIQVSDNAIAAWNGTSWQWQFAVAHSGSFTSVRSLELGPGQLPVVLITETYSPVPGATSETYLMVMRLVGGVWEGYGAGARLDAGGGNYACALSMDGALPVVAFSDGGQGSKLTVKRWDGTTWNGVGPPGLSTGAASSVDILKRTTDLLVAYSDQSLGGYGTVMRWDGTSWNALGPPGFTAAASSQHQLFMNGSTLLLLSRENGRLAVRQWIGTSWVALGNLSTMPVNDPTVLPQLAYFAGQLSIIYSQNGLLKVDGWTGSAWVGIASWTPDLNLLAFAVAGSDIYVKDGIDAKALVYNGSATLQEAPLFTVVQPIPYNGYFGVAYGGQVIIANQGDYLATYVSNGSTWGNGPYSGYVVVPNYQSPLSRRWTGQFQDKVYFTINRGGQVFVHECDLYPRVNLKLHLGGAYNGSNSEMTTLLRSQPGFPLTEPYTALGFTHVNGGGGESIPASLLSSTIVDWVLLELRSSTNTVLATKSCILYANGQVLAADGGEVAFPGVYTGFYKLAVRHRNHLGVVATGLWMNGSMVNVDLRQGSTSVFGANARRYIQPSWSSPFYSLWPGDATGDGVVKYVGAGNDRDAILIAVGGGTPSNTVSNVYDRRDVNLDGSIKYTGVNNDRDVILQTIGGTTPTATRTQQMP